MSSGATHDKINTFVMGVTLTLGLVAQSTDIVSIGLGIGLGTVWLSPDLDLATSNPTNRLGPLSVLLVPYRMLCGHHRSFWSHSPIVSSLIRAAYFMLPFELLCKFSGREDILLNFIRSPLFFWGLVGLEVATDLHLFLDFQYSYFKKIRSV